MSRDLNTGNYLSLPGVKFHVIDTAPSYGPTLSAAGVLMLEAVHLTKRYASLPAVQDLSFSLRPGQVLGCLGPNGSGKSNGEDAHRASRTIERPGPVQRPQYSRRPYGVPQPS